MFGFNYSTTAALLWRDESTTIDALEFILLVDLLLHANITSTTVITHQ